MKSFESVERIIDSLVRRNGGLTMSYENGVVDIFQPETGYQVGVGNIATIEYTDCIGKLENWLKALCPDLDNNHNIYNIGFWLNDGKLYVDRSIHFWTRKAAERTARDEKEIAIWSWADMEEITL